MDLSKEELEILETALLVLDTDKWLLSNDTVDNALIAENLLEKIRDKIKAP